MEESGRPSLLVQATPFGHGTISAERWFDALVAALAEARSAGAIGSWRISAGSEGSDSPLQADWMMRAQAAGGSFAAAHDGPLPDGDEELVLLLAGDVIVSHRTISRLVLGSTGAERPVAARELPLDGEDPPSCVLVNRSKAGNTGTVISRSVPQASVFRDRRRKPITLAVEAGDALLEEAVDLLAIDGLRGCVEKALTVGVEPLLSIVMRTQLARPEALRDALLCLAGQDDGRFELLLVVHDADVDAVAGIIAEQPGWLRSRTRVLTAAGGTRSRPLNVGFEAAAGSHVAVLDDDDLVFAHWAGSFLTSAGAHPRQLLRAAVGVQRVRVTEWLGGLEGYAAVSDVDVPYPATFDLADHLQVNMTPFMAVAFPRALLGILGGADESLEVCEDWDLVLRAARLVGVADIPAVTAIYRRWTSGRDSYTVHDDVVWERDMRRVRAKLDRAPLLLPPGSASALAAMSRLRADPSELAAVYSSTSWRVTAPLRALSRLAARLRGGAPLG